PAAEAKREQDENKLEGQQPQSDPLLESDRLQPFPDCGGAQPGGAVREENPHRAGGGKNPANREQFETKRARRAGPALFHRTIHNIGLGVLVCFPNHGRKILGLMLMPPNSLMMMAHLHPCYCVSRWLRSVVLPARRKPVRTVA